MLQSPYSSALQSLQAVHETTRYTDQESISGTDVPTPKEVRKFAGRLAIFIAGGFAVLTVAEHAVVTAGKPLVRTVEAAIDRLNGIECNGETDPYVTQPFDTFDGLAQRLDPVGVLNTAELSGFIQQQSGYKGNPNELPANMTIQLVRAGDCSQ